MNLQNLIKQFGNLGNFGGLGNLLNFNQQNFQKNESHNEVDNKNKEGSTMYPESFYTPDFNRPHNQNFNNPNEPNTTNNSGTCSACGLSSNRNSQPAQNPLGGLLGGNSDLSSLLPLLSMPKGKQGSSTDSLPDGLKGLAPFINMLSGSSEKTQKEGGKPSLSIDNLKKIEE